jgi:hypothetical protein
MASLPAHLVLSSEASLANFTVASSIVALKRFSAHVREAAMALVPAVV